MCVRIRGHMFESTLFYDPAAENHDEGNPTNYTSSCRQAGNNNNSPSPAHTDCIIKCRLLFPSSHTMAWDHRKAPSSVLCVSNCKRPPDEVLDSLSLAIPIPAFSSHTHSVCPGNPYNYYHYSSLVHSCLPPPHAS